MSNPRKIRCRILMESIDESLLYPGQKGRYLNLTLMATPNSPFGHDYMATQDVTRKQREADPKARGPILGNGIVPPDLPIPDGAQRTYDPEDVQPSRPAHDQVADTTDYGGDDSDLPF